MSDQGDVWWDDYARFPDGSWGVWVRSVEPNDGDLVDVTLPDRTVISEKIKHVLWRTDDGALCSIEPWTLADGRLRGRCGLCNSIRLWAFYPRYERQSILVTLDGNAAQYEYAGDVVGTESDPALGEMFFCSTCGRTAPSVESLVGLPDDAWYGGKGLQGDYYAMSSIHEHLRSQPWSLETLREIAQIVAATGRELEQPETRG